MSNLNYIYLVDVETGVETESGFTSTSKSIKAFGGDKSLFDFIAEVVDTKYESTVKRISNIVKYTFGGTIETFDLTFDNGNLKLVSKGTVQTDAEVPIIPDKTEE